MSDFTIRTSTTPPATVKVQLDPSQSVAEAVAAADAAAISAGEAAADAVSADASATTATTQAAAASASASAASTDADDAAASAAAAAATLDSSLKKADNLSDLASAPTALTNLGLTASAAQINNLLPGRNLIINGSGRINQRGYVSGAATSGANQFTLDRWFVITSGQSLTFTGDASARVMTAPAGGVSQVIEGANIVGGTYVLNWTGTATATVGGVARTKGETFTLTANTNVTVTFTSGTFTDVQLERGSVVTPFEWRSVGQGLALCQRYYWRGLPAGALNYPAYVTDAVMTWVVMFPVEMRVSPALASDFTGVTLSSTGTPAWQSQTRYGGRVLTISTAATNNAIITFAAGNFLAADAELTS